MSTIAKVLIAAVLAVGVGGGVAVAQASGGRDDPPGEVRGPCDEAEHANDPRCAGIAASAQQREPRARANDDRQRRNRHRGANRGRSGKSKAEDRRGSNSGRN